jgi:hypothetical protein
LECAGTEKNDSGNLLAEGEARALKNEEPGIFEVFLVSASSARMPRTSQRKFVAFTSAGAAAGSTRPEIQADDACYGLLSVEGSGVEVGWRWVCKDGR